MDNGFTFGGIHNSELGTAFLATKWPGSAPLTVNEATIPGRDGTIRLPGQTYGTKTLEGTLYILDPNDELMTNTQMMERISEIMPWLQPGGRQRLILDAEPDRLYLAEIVHGISFTTDDWENGAADLTFVLQPFAYARDERTVQLSVTAPNGMQAKTLTVPGNREAPLQAQITALASMTWVQLSTDMVHRLRLENLTLQSGDVVTIRADIDASEVVTVSVNDTAAKRYVQALSTIPLLLTPGANTITLAAGGACNAIVTARGRWR